MENAENGTLFIKDQISRCEDLDELKDVVFPMIQDQKTLWQEKINEIVQESPLNKRDFAAKCRVSRVTLDKWLKGSLPRDRETFIVIGLAAHYSIPEMNKFLTRYGRYPELYSKTLEDCVAIYVISNGYGDEAVEKYFEILDDINSKALNQEKYVASDVSTEYVNSKLSMIKKQDDLERFIIDNGNIFSKAYSKLFAEINMFIAANYTENIENLSLGQGWSSSLKQAVYEIRNGRWHPNRNKIISIGIHLSMTHDEVDELLSLAHMEPLCAKNTFESVIMYILDSAEIEGRLRTDRDYDKNNTSDFDPDELCKYALEILNEIDIPEIDKFLREVEGIEDE